MTDEFDFLVIGAGSGGVRFARLAAQRGAKVALFEGAATGGTCVNEGCIPKKLYAYAADAGDSLKYLHGFGWQCASAALDWGHLKRQRATEIQRLNGIYERMLSSAGVKLVRGATVLTSPGSVECEGVSWRGGRVLIATGGVPHVPGWPGAQHLVTSAHMFELASVPRRLVVIGGGYIACEFASIFASLGSSVTLIHRGERLLRGFDPQAARFLTGELVRRGIDVRFGCEPAGIESIDGELKIRLGDGNDISANVGLCATGRRARVKELGPYAATLARTADGRIQTDAIGQTSVAGVFAIGDVASNIALTPVATRAAGGLVSYLFDGAPKAMEDPLDYLVPTAIFTSPQMATVGCTEDEARAKYGDVAIYESEFRELKEALKQSGARTFMKLVVARKTGKVVGMHMVGPEAGEVIQGFAVAMTAGATKADFDRTLGIHPTVAEEFVTMRQAARN